MRGAIHRLFGKERDAQTQRIKNFSFPEGSTIVLKSGKSVDVSGIRFHLANIFEGGIGYGGGGGKLLARTMDAIGHNGTVYNLPVCIENIDGFEVISTLALAIPLVQVKEIIDKALTTGYTCLNIVLNIDNHTSLASVSINKETAIITFYDSLSSDHILYASRYNDKLHSFIQSLLPNKTYSPSTVVHILDQGGRRSCGCGYYALYTALLLTKDESMQLFTFDRNIILFNEKDDIMIRADLVVRTLLTHGLSGIDTSCYAGQKRDAIFYRIDYKLVRFLITQLSKKLQTETT